MLERIEKELRKLESEAMLRHLPVLKAQGIYVEDERGNRKLNLSSNDYLCIASDKALRRRFLETVPAEPLSASSSRLMGGFFEPTVRVERLLEELYDRAALVFGSGYSVNLSVLPALSTSRTLILADRLVHASLIDGIRLSAVRWVRFRHNDVEHLESLLREHHAEYEEIIVVSESTFSMDGDRCDVCRLVELKRMYDNVYLYIDTAHDAFTSGERGLGELECQGVLQDVDFVVATFGKALGGAGACLISSPIVKSYMVNKARGFIFSTAISPLQMSWNGFVLEHLAELAGRRKDLADKSAYFRKRLEERGIQTASLSHIIPIVLGSPQETLRKSEEMLRRGFNLLAVRPPSVEPNASRLRISLFSGIGYGDLDRLAELL